jgi:G3E family GTPase
VNLKKGYKAKGISSNSQESNRDRTVTVIDIFNQFTNFDTAHFLSDRYGYNEIISEEERIMSNLMVDQIEFADVIIINKIETVNENVHRRIRELVKLLDPDAKALETNFCRVDVREVIETNKFNFLKAASGAGWLISLHEMTIMDTRYGKRLAPR